MSKLVIWSATRSEWTPYPDDKIIWLDRILLSEGRDVSLHRSPRCPGLRYVHHRWEVFSRDPTHSVFVAPFHAVERGQHQLGADAAQFVLPAARAGLESQPVQLDAGGWAIGVGRWTLRLCVDVSPEEHGSPTMPGRMTCPRRESITCLLRTAAAISPQA